MMCFRDRTYCASSECANFQTCDRTLTDDVKSSALAWWGKEGAPIAVSEFDCFEEKIQK